MTTMGTPAELRRRVFGVLVRELGYAETVRFMLQFERGRGDYSRDRDAMIPKWSVEEMVQEANRLADAAARDPGPAGTKGS